MTSAPMSPRNEVATGPTSQRVKSTTRIPTSGPSGVVTASRSPGSGTLGVRRDRRVGRGCAPVRAGLAGAPGPAEQLVGDDVALDLGRAAADGAETGAADVA